MQIPGNEISEKNYTLFWQDNIQKLDEIGKNLDALLEGLELEYSQFEPIYRKIEEDINVLSSIYSSFNSIGGRRYVMKLRAVLTEYRKRYTREGIDFDMMHFLLSRISQLRDESLSLFPALRHSEARPTPGPSAGDSGKRPFRWITFRRNGSCFMAPYSNVETVSARAPHSIIKNRKDSFTLTLEEKEYAGRDLFSEFSMPTAR
jgi:hypothetical protein